MSRPFTVACDDETVPVSATPEPVTIALLGTGLFGIGGARLPQGIVNQAAIDAGNHDHDAEQQAQSKVGQDEAQQVVLDVPVGQIHRIGSSAIVAARPTRSPPRSCTTTRALSGKPPVIS